MATAQLLARGRPALVLNPNAPRDAAGFTYLFREADTSRGNNGGTFTPFLDTVSTGSPFVVALAAASRYLIEVQYQYVTTLAANAMRTSTAFPAASTVRYTRQIYGGSAISVGQSSGAANPLVLAHTGLATADLNTWTWQFQITTVGAGNFALSWCGDGTDAAAQLTLLRGSYLRYRLI